MSDKPVFENQTCLSACFRWRKARTALLLCDGMTEEINQPLICNDLNEAAPCNISLARQAQAVNAAARHAGSPRVRPLLSPMVLRWGMQA